MKQIPCGQIDASIYPMSAHASARLRQRGISSEALAMVLDYGDSDRSHGADRFFLPAKARVALVEELDLPRSLLDRLNLNVVVADNGTVVTVAHAIRRRKRAIQERWGRRRQRRTAAV